MPIRTNSETLVAGSYGAKCVSADGGSAVFTITPAGGAPVQITVHAGGVVYADGGSTVGCNGTWSYTEVAL